MRTFFDVGTKSSEGVVARSLRPVSNWDLLHTKQVYSPLYDGGKGPRSVGIVLKGRSIKTSRGPVELTGLEPVTPGLQGQCSPN